MVPGVSFGFLIHDKNKLSDLLEGKISAASLSL